MKGINSITLEIISNGITSIAEQMGVILAKTGYSTNIKERKDLSVAVFSVEGKLLSLAQHIPLHFSSLSGAVEVLTKKYRKEDIYEQQYATSDHTTTLPTALQKDLIQLFIQIIGAFLFPRRNLPLDFIAQLMRIFKEGNCVMLSILHQNIQVQTLRICKSYLSASMTTTKQDGS